jgi:NADPH:quinone reductase-like Zn-dependent oxidoreductase
MKAIVYERYGGPEALELREVPRPRVGPGRCLVRVAAASVNPADWKLLAGNWRWVTGRRAPRRPRRIGIDFSGTVEQAGTGVRVFREGEAVMGMVNALTGGSLAEYVSVPASVLSRKPKTLSFEEAAGVPVACATAYVGLRHRRKDLAGRPVLLTGAGGGVGHFAVQLAALFGARLTAVCSAAKAALCRELGALEVVDYNQTDLRALGPRYDLVFDCASRIPYEEAKRLLRPGGEYLLLDTRGRVWPFFRAMATQLSPGPRLWTFLITPDGRMGSLLAGLFERHGLRVVVGSRYPLEQAAQAVRESMGGHATGKIVVTVAP